MGAIAYLSHNDNVLTGTSITASSTASGYNVNDLIDLPYAKPHRFGGDSSVDYQIDLGAAQSIDAFLLGNHNLTSGATITVNGGSSANPNGGQYTTTLSWRERDAFRLLTSAQTWRYWKIILDDPSNPSGFIQAGYAWFGLVSEFSFKQRYGMIHRDVHHNFGQRSEFGVPFVSRGFRQTGFELSFHAISAAQMNEIRSFLTDHSGDRIPFFLIPDLDIYDGWFGRVINREFEFEVDFFRAFTLHFLEDSPGRILAA